MEARGQWDNIFKGLTRKKKKPANKNYECRNTILEHESEIQQFPDLQRLKIHC